MRFFHAQSWGLVLIEWHAGTEGGGRESPGVRVTFFRVAERKSPKKGRPYCARPFAALRAACDARTEGAPQNSLRATRSVQTTAASQRTKCVCPSARAEGNPKMDIHTGHCFAALRSAPSRGRKRHALRRHGRAQQWPEWMSGCSAVRLFGCSAVRLFGCSAVRLFGCSVVRLFGCSVVRLFGCSVVRLFGCLDVWMFGCSAVHPLLAVPTAGRLWGEHGRRSAHASSTDSPWMSERRAQRKASSTAHPTTTPPQVCPGAKRRGRRLGVAFSLVTFFWRSKRKLLASRATPGLRTQTRHTT